MIDEPTRESANQLARELRAAMLLETFVDEQGRTVRRWHSVIEYQSGPNGLELVERWQDIRTASPEFMAESFKQRTAKLKAELALLDELEQQEQG